VTLRLLAAAVLSVFGCGDDNSAERLGRVSPTPSAVEEATPTPATTPSGWIPTATPAGPTETPTQKPLPPMTATPTPSTTIARATPTPTRSGAAVEVLIGSGEGTAGGTVTIGIEMKGSPHSVVSGVQVDVLFDSTAFNVPNPPMDCALDSRLMVRRTVGLAVGVIRSFPAPPGQTILRFAVITRYIGTEWETFDDGPLGQCTFQISPYAAAGVYRLKERFRQVIDSRLNVLPSVVSEGSIDVTRLLNGFCCDMDCAPPGRCDVPFFEGTCITLLADGDDCELDAQCFSGVCDDGICSTQTCDDQGTCRVKLPNWSSCDLDDECVSGVCDIFDGICCNRSCHPNNEFCDEGFCAPFYETRIDGDRCAWPDQCISRNCVDGACCQATTCPNGQECQLGTGQCGPAANNGELCSGEAECTSGYCVNGVCCRDSTCLAGEVCEPRSGICRLPRANGHRCAIDLQCTSGFCVDSSARATTG
jgi:hypothetical protein